MSSLVIEFEILNLKPITGNRQVIHRWPSTMYEVTQSYNYELSSTPGALE